MVETKQQVFNSAIRFLNLLVCTPSEENQVLMLTARYEAASDETPEQSACPFCHLEPGHAAEWRNDVWGVQTYLLGKKLSIYIRGQLDSFPIAYCPQCGRKL